MVLGVVEDGGVLRRFANDQLLTLAKLVVENALQPIVEVGTGAVFGYESLMRGHDRIGFQSPLDLLDQAYESGELLALEQMVSSRALAKFATLPDCSAATLFLNLDVRLIRDGNALVDTLLDQLRKANIPPSSVCFELSERFDNTQVPEFSGLIARLRRSGFKLAIDDFGVGHGEMKLLCDFPVDYVKIDRHFIAGLDSNPRKRHLVKNIVNFCHVLGVRVIAEGIETEAEFIACREFGVDLVQGWFIARPTTMITELKSAFPHLQEIGKVRRSTQSLDEVLIRKQIELMPTVYEHENIEHVFDLFRRNPGQSFFPVLNANGEPRGIINEIHLKEYIYQPFGRDLLKNKVYERSISHFVDRAPIVGLDADAERLMTIFANMEGSDCVILTENMRYAGVVSAASLIRVMNEKRLKTAQDQNPLTGLPGNRAIRDYMRDIALDGDGGAYVTDSFAPVIYRIDAHGKASIYARDARFHTADGFNLNGIAWHPDGYLLVGKYNSGELFRVSTRDPADIQPVQLPEALKGADGFQLLDSQHLIVVQNLGADRTVELVSTDGWKTATLARQLKSIASMPTAATRIGNQVYVLNGRLDTLFDPAADKVSDYLLQKF